MNSKPLLSTILILALLITACGVKKRHMTERLTEFEVVIHNTSETSSTPTALSPGAWAVHTTPYPMYKTGKPDMDMGLESLAEDGVPGPLLDSLLKLELVAAAGIFNTPSDMAKPGPLMPGALYTFAFKALPGDHLSFATMFIESNDLFFGTIDKGIPLFEKGVPLNGEITSRIQLWDCGTERNEVPGIGLYQASRQKGPDMGAPEHKKVHGATGAFPEARDMIRVTITPTITKPRPSGDGEK